MKVGQNYFPKSSFLSIDKDLALIVNKILQNQRLCKLLYYTQKDCLQAEDLSMEQRISLLNNHIRIIPKLPITTQCPNYIIITMTDFTPTDNPEFRDCTINFQVLCHPDHWNLGNFALRPYKILGELDAMFNEQKLTGIGTLNFQVCTDLTMNDQECGFSLSYTATHGIEDKINPLA